MHVDRIQLNTVFLFTQQKQLKAKLCSLFTGKGVLSEHEHFPSGASGQSSLEYKCAYLCIYIRNSSQDYDSIKIFIKISCILAITHGNCNQSGPVLGGLTI